MQTAKEEKQRQTLRETETGIERARQMHIQRENWVYKDRYRQKQRQKRTDTKREINIERDRQIKSDKE